MSKHAHPFSQCPQCEEWIQADDHIDSVVLNQLGHDWHKVCWEAFQVEYEQILSSNLVKES
jgi:hypothetical protein